MKIWDMHSSLFHFEKWIPIIKKLFNVSANSYSKAAVSSWWPRVLLLCSFVSIISAKWTSTTNFSNSDSFHEPIKCFFIFNKKPSCIIGMVKGKHARMFYLIHWRNKVKLDYIMLIMNRNNKPCSSTTENQNLAFTEFLVFFL